MNTEILHWTALGHLHLRQGSTTLVIPQNAKTATIIEARRTIARLQRRVEMLESYREGKTTQSPEAL